MRSAFSLLLLLAVLAPLPAQELAVLHITVTVTDADGRVRQVPRHALLISDNPASAPPRRVVTSTGGTADVRLRPGNYIVESDEPLLFQGRSYQWAQTVDVIAGRGASLELTAANADPTTTGVSAGQSSPSELLMQWQGNVVNLWSPTARGAGFVFDRRGLILTNQRLVGTADSVEVQFTSTRKVAARVLAADPARNVAILWVHPSLVSGVGAAKLAMGGSPAEGQDVFALDATVIDLKSLASGRITRVEPRVLSAEVRIDRDSVGVPLMSAAGEIVAITTFDDDSFHVRAVRIDEARAVIAEAVKMIAGAVAPTPAPLPVEPQRVVSEDVLKSAAPPRIGNLAPYQVSTEDFDVSFITPTINYRGQHPPDRTTGASKAGGEQDIMAAEMMQQMLQDYGNWTEYVAEIPPVLLIRATPKLKEGFWTTVGRAAARTQGVALPPFKRMKDSFAAMRLYCGDAEVTPIHPFRIERRVDAGNGMFEGLYVFDPASISGCGRVRLELFSEKEPGKGDSRILEPGLVEQLAKDLALVR